MSAVVSSKVESNIPNYRQQVRRALPAECFAPHVGNISWFPVHFGIVGGAWWLLAVHFSFWLAPIVAIVVGHSFACMGFVAHDIGHGGSIRHPFLRDLMAAVGFSPFGIGPHLWRKWHNADHHNNTQIPGVDPDHLLTMEDYKHNPILRFLYRLSPLARNLVIFSSFSYRMQQQSIAMLIRYLRSDKTTAREKAIMLAQCAMPLGFWIGASAVLGSQVLLWGYLLPMLVANSIAISYIATNHFLNPLADERDVLATSLTVTLPKWLGFLDPWHSRFGAHVAHHLFPQASCKHARTIEAKVAELWPDRYHTLPLFTALKALWDTPWVYEDHTTLIDPRRQVRAKTLGHGFSIRRRKRQVPPPKAELR